MKTKTQIERFNKEIRLHDDYVGLLIYGNGCDYPIEHYRMDTPEKVLAWVLHLSEKGNVTTDHIRAFVLAAHQELGVKVDFHC